MVYAGRGGDRHRHDDLGLLFRIPPLRVDERHAAVGFVQDRFGLSTQLLHAYKLVFTQQALKAPDGAGAKVRTAGAAELPNGAGSEAQGAKTAELPSGTGPEAQSEAEAAGGSGLLSYLAGKTITAELPPDFARIKTSIFGNDKEEIEKK